MQRQRYAFSNLSNTSWSDYSPKPATKSNYVDSGRSFSPLLNFLNAKITLKKKGEKFVSRGSRNGQTIYVGPHGGRFTLTPSGAKNYSGF